MKRAIFLLCILAFSGIGNVYAERGDHYWLLKGGVMWLSADDDPDALKTLGLTYGYGLTQRLSLEVDYDRSFSGGSYSSDPDKGEYKIWLASANVAYRYLIFSGLYIKPKLGFTYDKLTRSSDQEADDDNSTTDISASLGLGYLAGPLLGSSTTFELSYTRHNKDVSSAMLGVNLTF